MKYTIHEGLTYNLNTMLPSGARELKVSAFGRKHLSLNATVDQVCFKLLRKLSAKKKFQTLGIDWFPDLRGFLAMIEDVISREKNRRKCIAVLAPWKEEETLSKREGYIRRIAEIDETVLGDSFCLYLYECPYYRPFTVTVDRVGENRLYIRYNSSFLAHRQFVEEIIGMCDFCYSHSILRVIPVVEPENDENWIDIFKHHTPHVLDIHGETISEARMRGDIDDIPWLEKAEKMYFGHISYAIVLTEQMKEFYKGKYGGEGIEFYLTPVINQDRTVASTGDGCKDEMTVYCGGCQKWQNIDLMASIIKCRKNDMDFVIYVNDTGSFMQIWGSDPIPENVIVQKGDKEEIINTYRKAKYGFALRDDNILNRVACPTKLMEYLQFGILPVLKFEEIGDFQQLGLQFVSAERFIAGELPSDEDREGMVRKNDMILDKLCTIYEREINRLKQLLSE